MSVLELREPAEAREPAEVRGAGRDDVRLLVARRDGNRSGAGRARPLAHDADRPGAGGMHDEPVEHARFHDLPELLVPGDLLVINTSGTLPAAIPVRGPDPALTLNLSSPLPDQDGAWLAELRRAGERYPDGRPGQVLLLPAGGTAVLLERYRGGRLWLVSLRLPAPVPHYLVRHAEPIRYAHAARAWPLESYQNVYATEPGSAEMPSAGRAFTPELVTRLVAGGIDLAPIVLHTGVSSLEIGEAPLAESYRVPSFTAERVNLARRLGGRAIAVGTTVVRALESAVADDGQLRESEGWTELVIEPDTEIRALDGLLSGFHDRDSSHLAMLEAIGGRELLELSYEEAGRAGYLRHEFGDLHLILR